jgi:inhibitor of KinA
MHWETKPSLLNGASSISEEVNNQVMHSFHFLQIHPIEGVTDLIPAYSSLTLLYNPTIIRKQAMGGSPFEWLKKKLAALTAAPSITFQETAPIVVPVCYDTSLAPDLVEATQITRCSIEELIALHTSKIYKVYMLGFLPGFCLYGIGSSTNSTTQKSQP